MIARVSLFSAALWWGSLSAVGFLVVPMLFVHMPSPAIAGRMAAKLFAAQTWLSVACGVVLMLINQRRARAPNMDSLDAPRTSIQGLDASMLFIIFGLLMALLIEYGVAPRIVARENLRLWHSAGTVMYGLQWLCAAVVLWRTVNDPQKPLA
ncbi:DUF4149 domain-containing protein [Ottowia thiooxydans]|uniref:DUF4149 domain-containing protein n=1 Tax=Ottowia thiooxydans TaxID=219182 RepID=UPI0004916CF5|nr:DUF4149 domain-containing protein [Ottowia thiooxydans]